MKKIIRVIYYIIKVITVFKNWVQFLLDHADIRTNVEEYKLRNGLRVHLLRTETGDWSTDMMMDIFIRNDYGKMPINSTIIDIGSNVGVFALYAVYGNKNICYCYEPEINNYNILKKNIDDNLLSKSIKPFNLAVSGDKADKKLYKYESIAHSLYRESEEFDIVHSIDLNSIVIDNNIEHIGLIKIDCEGSEFEILYNTNDEIYNKIKCIIVEYHNYSDIPEYKGNILLNFLQNKGFVLLSHKLIDDGLLGIIKLERK